MLTSRIIQTVWFLLGPRPHPAPSVTISLIDGEYGQLQAVTAGGRSTRCPITD